ncbi:hypothetical protein K439DRAFT_1325744 [Ramaria rubella]|nr:hypothetical protein K439DRAFT_1325744 [Ramaria rubella]
MTSTSSPEIVDPPPQAFSSTGFPPGYFIIRNLGTGRVLDIKRDERHDGAEAILYPEMESSHVLSLYISQVFFIDYLGTLCSKASGHGIDYLNIGDGQLVLRHRRPVTMPFPNKMSHPLPRFNYSPQTAQISVSFAYDPAHHGPNSDSASLTHDKTYILSSIPIRKPRGILKDASDFLQVAASAIPSPFAVAFGVLGVTDPSTSASAAEVRRGGFDLREDETSEVDRVEEDSIDDSPDPLRRVRVISLANGAVEDVGTKTRERRRWEVIPLLKSKAMTGPT